MITLNNIQTEQDLNSLLSPITDTNYVQSLGNSYDPNELRGNFSIKRESDLSISYNPNSSKPWVICGVISNVKCYKTFTSVRKHLAKILEV